MADGTIASAAYPAEVEDLLDGAGALGGEALCAAGVAGYAVVAGAGATRAHLFAVAGAGGGSGSGAPDALALPLPAPAGTPGVAQRASRLAAWGAGRGRVSVAALDAAGPLRIYCAVDPAARAPPRPREVRVARALALSARADAAHVPALELVRAGPVAAARDALFVFGARGSAALVSVDEHAPVAHPLARDAAAAAAAAAAPDAGKRSSISFGQFFYSALRSIGADTRPDAPDWEAGVGRHRIVGAGALTAKIAACVVREGGAAECWGPDHLLWEGDVFEFAGPRAGPADRRVVCASVSAEDTLVCLLEEIVNDVPLFRIVGFAARERPHAVTVQIDLSDITEGAPDVDVRMTLSEGLAYVHVPGSRRLSWVSVAGGISETDQVHGSVALAEGVKVLHVLDAAHATSGHSSDAVSGGLVACLCADAVNLVSSGVPAPMSMQGDEVAAPVAPTEEIDVNAMLWRAQLQFRAGQTGAVRASLRGLYRATFVNRSPSAAFLGEVVHDASQFIISSRSNPASAPVALLVDDELERRQDDYNSFVRLLGDAEVFSCIREAAPSTTDDRLWDALTPDVRHAILCHGEKLSVARAVRDVENRHVSGDTSQVFRGAATASIIGSEAHGRTASMAGSVLMEDLREVEADLCEGTSIVSRALHRAGVSARADENRGEEASFLYRFPLHFHIFLPALSQCVGDVIRRARVAQEDQAGSGGAVVQRALRNIILLACESAIAVVRAARESRATAIAQLERDQYVLHSFRQWSSDDDSRNTLEVLVEAALELRSGARQNELAQLRVAAAIVSDELLACTQTALFDSNGAPGALTPAMKKRRLIEGADASQWGRARTKVLDRLRIASLTDVTLELAEKYRDFGTILSLKKDCDDFDAYFASSLENYGDEFGFYALRWLEERGEIGLLLKGRVPSEDGMQTGLSARSDRIAALVSTYFLEERGASSNLSWMHWLGTGNVAEGSRVLTAHIKNVATPGHPGSLQNTRTLTSIARLAQYAVQLEGDDGDETVLETEEERAQFEDDSSYVQGQLHLAWTQHHMGDPEAYDALLSVEDLVRNYVDKAPVASQKLAEYASVAIEAVHYSKLSEQAMCELTDYVWRRCVEREGHTWMQIVSKCRQVSDGQLRDRLEGTAIFLVAKALGTTVEGIQEIVQRNAFKIPEFNEKGCQLDLENVVQKTVGLAVATK